MKIAAVAKSLLLATCMYISVPLYGQNAVNKNLDVFYRCFAHLTRKRPPIDMYVLDWVKRGWLSPVDACMHVLSKAELNSLGRLKTVDNISKDVIQTMNSFHSSWFGGRMIHENVPSSSCSRAASREIYDNAEPGLHITKALLGNGGQYKDIVTATHSLEAIRSQNNDNAATGPMRSHLKPQQKKSDRIYYLRSTPGWNFRFVSVGQILGIQPARPMKIPGNGRDIFKPLGGGGGVLGSPTFVLSATEEDTNRFAGRIPNFKSNGTEKMLRRWTKKVYSELLCRDLPVIRSADAKPFVMPNSKVAFRTGVSCIRCHASIDRGAGVIRNLAMSQPGVCKLPNDLAAIKLSPFVLDPYTTNKSAEKNWPASPDKDFAHRPTHGYVYFRSLSGQLVSQKVKSVQEFGETLSQTEDLYACAAKRYFEYFTGISVSLEDIKSPDNKLQLNKEQMKQRNFVVGLGRKLKQKQSLKALVRNIFESSYYQDVYNEAN